MRIYPIFQFTDDKLKLYEEDTNPMEDVIKQRQYLENMVSSLQNQVFQEIRLICIIKKLNKISKITYTHVVYDNA